MDSDQDEMEKLYLQIKQYSKTIKKNKSGFSKENTIEILKKLAKKRQTSELFFQALRQNYPTINDNFKKWIANQRKKKTASGYLSQNLNESQSLNLNGDNEELQIDQISDSIYQRQMKQQNYHPEQFIEKQQCSEARCLELASFYDERIKELKRQTQEEQEEIKKIQQQIELQSQLLQYKMEAGLTNLSETFEMIYSSLVQKNKQFTQLIINNL